MYKSGAQGLCACSGPRAANHCALHSACWLKAALHVFSLLPLSDLFMCHLAEAAQVCGLLPLSALFLCHFAEAAQVWSACPFGFVPLPFCGGRPLSLSGLLLSQTCKDNNGKPRGSCSASALLSIGANSQNFRAATGGSYGPKNDACEVPVFRCFWRPKISALLAVLS